MRGGLSEKDVTNRMANQLDEEEKIRRSHFVIVNDQTQAIFESKLSRFLDMIKSDEIRNISSFPHFIK
ncbi:hypothetical protein MASR1M107_07510 [Ignavibacteriales bacterium]